MHKRIVQLVLVASIMLSTNIFACPNEAFQRQTGDFDWMINGSFNGHEFNVSGTSYEEFVNLLEQYYLKLKNADPEEAVNMFIPIT